MILREIFTAHVRELLLIAIGAYVAVKTYGTRNSSRVTKAFSAFATANMIFQALDFCMALNRGGVCLSGFAVGAFIYIVTLTAMAGTGYHWFIYVEEAIGAKTFASKKNLFLWSVPLIIFFVLCAASVRTGWIFTFNAEGKYVIGSLFIIQYVVVFGYCLLAMVRSAVNFFVKKERRATDRTLLLIMLVDTAAVIIQLSFAVNMMDTALVLTVLLSYMTIYSSEIERIKISLEQERLLARKQEEEQRTLINKQILLEYFVDQYWSASFIDLKNDTLEIIRADNANTSAYIMDGSQEDMNRFIESHFHPDDKALMLQITNKDFVRKELKDKSTISYTAREIIDGAEKTMRIQIVRCEDEDHVAVGFMDITDEIEEEKQLRKETEVKLAHEQLRSDVFSYMTQSDDDDPVELISSFAERVRSLLDCDQLIYRDLEETRIMVNSPAIEETWSVPIEYCRQCEHFDAHHPMYKDGYTEMSNCQEGWQGIPVYKDCPIKSSLTRIVYCDGEAAGYLAIHYVQNYHEFTELEHATIEEFAYIFSMSLSRYKARKENRELKRIREMQTQIEESNRIIGALSEDFGSVNYVELTENKDNDFAPNYRVSDLLKELIPEWEEEEAFTKKLQLLIDHVVYEPDRKRFFEETRREVVLEHLRNSDTCYVNTRMFFDNEIRYYQMKFSAIRENGEIVSVVAGIHSVDEQMKKERERQEELQEALTFTNFFLDTYVSAYYVDLNTRLFQVHKRSDELVRDYPVIKDYYSSITEYISRDVHPDDREKLLDIVNPENMKSALKTKPEFSHIFRDVSGGREKYYRMQVIRGTEESHAAFGFIDITDEVNEQNRRQLEAEESKKLIDSIAASYNVAYAVNMKTDAFRLLRMDASIIGSDRTFNTFTEAKEFFIGILPESDRDSMRRELSYDTIREKLRDTKSYNVEYRVPINGAIIWHIMNVTLIDNDYAAIGFAERDLEITQKHLEDKRYGEYFALYEIDIDTGMMKIVKDSPYYGIDRSGTAMPYRPAMLKFASVLDDEPRMFFEQLADLDYVRNDLAEENKRTYAYRSNNVGDKNWVDCTGYVTLRHDDGTPAMFTLGFSLVDSLGVYRQELQSRYKEALDVVNEEKKRNDILHDIINSGKWSFKVDAEDKVIEADYSRAVMRVINNDFSSGVNDWIEILHPDDKEETLKAFQAAIADHSGRTPYDVTYRMADRNGEYHWFHSAGRIIRNEDGIGEFFGIHIDITSQIEEQLKQQDMLKKARIAADAANQAKSNFLFNMSHDIRTPMNAIRGFTTMAKKNADNRQKVIEYLDKIDISGEQLLKLVNQVLEMARIESGKITFEEKPVNVREEFNSMVTVLSEQAKANGLEFNYSLGRVEHSHVLADEARVSSITLNITGNAMKYTPEGGRIEFSLKEIESRKPGWASYLFTVADTGIGMSEEYLKELYEPFSREKSSTVSKIQGTGLGMSIVKELLDLMGGSIEVRSALGKGTRFDITLDFRIDDAAGQQAGEDDAVRPVSFKGRRVLLVEDNEMNREIARDILEEQGIIVEDADDGDTAVAMVKAIVDRGEFHYYDFILMDVQMPRMNGYEATKAIRAIPGPDGVHIPIIAMTANAFEEDRQNALAAGMDEHLAKPIDVRKAFRTIAKFLK